MKLGAVVEELILRRLARDVNGALAAFDKKSSALRRE
jgi:hypothetical protein